MLDQIHILDSNIADLIFYKVNIVNTLVNSQRLPHIFYKKDFILKY